MATIEPGQLFVFDQPTEKAWADARQIRNLFTALAQTNYTTDAAYPSAPRAGMARLNASDPNNIKLEFWQGSPGAWRTSLQNIQGGVPAPIKQIVQITAAATVWTIDHNLGNYAIALAFDSSFRQLRPANTFEKMPLFLGRVDLAAAVTGPLRTAVPTPFDGQIRRSWAFTPSPGILGAPAGTVSFDIGGTPVTGGQIVIAATAPGVRTNGAPITAANAFVKGNDDINLLATIGAAGVAGDALEVWAELEKTLQADEYFLDQPTENRIVVTHPTPKQGWVVLIG